MSVLFKSPSSSGGSIGGGSSKGFPPGDISNIIVGVNNQRIQVKWQDPDDTIIDGITLSKWKGTILIRNSDHYPTSIKDGDVVIDNTERNKYKDIAYEDDNLVNDHIYYYRFFVYSEDKVYNDSGNLVFKDKPMSYDPILKNNTWEQVITANRSNNIPFTWKVGDEIDLTLSGTFNETVTLQIWDFNHYDKSDGTGKANICFGMKHLMNNSQQMNPSDYNRGGWNECAFRKNIIPKIYNSIPIELRNVIKEVKTEANAGDNSSKIQTCNDKVFLPGWGEVGYYAGYDGNQVKFSIFTDDNSRIKKMKNGSGSASSWWTRSPVDYDSYGPKAFHRVTNEGGEYESGGGGYYSSAHYRLGICFCFNI